MATFNGKDGVWRTVGGRHIFIANGQSLKDAMRASGKFKNLKDDDFSLWKEENSDKIAEYYTSTYSKDLKNINQKVWDDIAKDIYEEEKLPEKINKMYVDENGTQWTRAELRESWKVAKESGNTDKDFDSYVKQAMNEKRIDNSSDKPYLDRDKMMDIVDKWSDKGFNEEGAYGNDGYGKGVLHQRLASGSLEGWGGEADDFVIKDFDMGSVNQKKALSALNEELNKKGYEARYLKEVNSTTSQDIEIKKIKSPATKSVNALNEIDRIAGDDTFLQKKGRELGLKEFKKYMEGKPDDFIKRKNNKQSTSNDNDTSKFTMVNDSGKTVTVTKSDMDGKWYDSDGNKYMSYLSKSDVKSYFKGSWKEVKDNSDSTSNQLNKTMDNKTQVAKALGLKVDESWKSTKQLYKEQKGIDLAEKAINSGKAGDYLKLRDRVDSKLMENTFDYERNFNNMNSIKKYAKLYDLDPDTLYYTTNLASNADINSLRKAAEVQKSRGMSLSQLKQMYINQGYSKETAARMAREDISERG